MLKFLPNSMVASSDPEKKTKLLVLSRSMVEKYHPEEPSILISIANYKQEPAQLLHRDEFIDVLFLQFDDIYPKEKETFPYLILISEKEAVQVWEFLEKHKTVNTIVVNCQAGISRSSAVTAVIALHLLDEDDLFWKAYHPNYHVYRIMLDAPQKKGKNNGRKY